ncbi:recombinase zinc ribbon domain-containing protein, partial [Saccharopolyspora rosea]
MKEFTRAQLKRKAKSAGGLHTARKTERSARRTKRPYLFRGRVRCGVCSRKMEASPRAHAMYYRCPARTLAPGSPALADHPPAVYLREDVIRDAVNGWIGQLFNPGHLDRTVSALLASQQAPGGQSEASEKA